jgi:hypothetical protein
MRTFLVAVTIALLTVPAYAQMMSRGDKRPGSERKTEQKVDPRKQKADEAAYKAALDKIPAQKFDPWQNIRGTEPDKNKKNSK